MIATASRHQARGGPRFADQPRQRRQHLRQMPRQASRKLTTKASTASCSPRATSARRSAPIATPRTRSAIPRATISKDQRRALRQVPRRPARSLPGDLPRQGDGARQANVAPEVAACYDCHGHHDVQPPSNPASHLSSANILATCQQCHPGATAGFTSYNPTPIRSTPRTIRCSTSCS